MVDPEVVLLSVVAGKAMANAAAPPANAPRIAKPTFGVDALQQAWPYDSAFLCGRPETTGASLL